MKSVPGFLAVALALISGQRPQTNDAFDENTNVLPGGVQRIDVQWMMAFNR